MIRKLLRRVFRRAAPANAVSEPAVIPVERHGVRRESISPAANKVCAVLQENGHKAYVVGGAVRDVRCEVLAIHGDRHRGALGSVEDAGDLARPTQPARCAFAPSVTRFDAKSDLFHVCLPSPTR